MEMDRRQVVTGALALAAGPLAAPRPTQTGSRGARFFTNPLDVKLADPCMIRVEGTCYLYATASLPQDVDAGMPVWSSADMIRWQGHGLAYAPKPDGWGTHWFWGPDVTPAEGGFLMYYGAFRKIDGKDVGRICVARSRSPLGPFEDIKAPMFDWKGGDAIDAFCFRDRDGQAYLFFTEVANGRNTIAVARLSADLLSLASEPVTALAPDQPWEVDPVNEGAHVWREGDRCFMMYSVNDFRNPAYAMGLAFADRPEGPWRKRKAGPILRQADGLRGPGCAGLIRSPDGRELWAYYHVHLHPEGYARQLALSRARYVRAGDHGLELSIAAPAVAPQRLPSGVPDAPQPRSDGLAGAELDRNLWTIVDEVSSNWTCTEAGVTVTALDGDMWRARCDYRNLFLQPPSSGDFEVSVNVQARLEGNYEQAFLIAWQDADNFVRLGMLHADGPKFSSAIELNGIYEELIMPNDLGPAATLRIRRRGKLWSFAVRGASDWQPIGDPREAPLQLPRAGFGAIAPGTKRPYRAVFRSFTWNGGR